MKHTYLIGEIGQNHNGSVDIAKLLIDKAAQEIIDPLFKRQLKGWDAVKFTKRDLDFELTQSAMNRPYDSPNSFGKTYGDHRAFLELSNEDHHELYQYAKNKNLDFVETLCAISCIDILNVFSPDYLKVASRDLTNLPLLEAMAETKIPMIISTGMAGKKEIDEALNVIYRHNSNVSILHCLSQYPSDYKNINLRTIHYLKKEYPELCIGYSDHSIGIAIPLAAVAMGAEIVEKHITLDRRMKGTDQAGSLEADGMWRLVRDIRNLEDALGKEEIFISEVVKYAQSKLERSIASNKELVPGHMITENDLHLLSPGDGIKWSERKKIIGRKVVKKIRKNELIDLKSIIE